MLYVPRSDLSANLPQIRQFALCRRFRSNAMILKGRAAKRAKFGIPHRPKDNPRNPIGVQMRMEGGIRGGLESVEESDEDEVVDELDWERGSGHSEGSGSSALGPYSGINSANSEQQKQQLLPGQGHEDTVETKVTDDNEHNHEKLEQLRYKLEQLQQEQLGGAGAGSATKTTIPRTHPHLEAHVIENYCAKGSSSGCSDAKASSGHILDSDSPASSSSSLTPSPPSEFYDVHDQSRRNSETAKTGVRVLLETTTKIIEILQQEEGEEG